MAVVEINQTNHDELLEQGIVIVEAWASWCGPCRIAGPLFEEASELNTDVTFGSINVDEEQPLAGAHSVQSIPTVMAFKNGEKLYQQAGVHNVDQLNKLVNELKNVSIKK